MLVGKEWDFHIWDGDIWLSTHGTGFLRVLDQWRQNTKLSKGDLINLEALSWDTGFNNFTRISGDGANMLKKMAS